MSFLVEVVDKEVAGGGIGQGPQDADIDLILGLQHQLEIIQVKKEYKAYIWPKKIIHKEWKPKFIRVEI